MCQSGAVHADQNVGADHESQHGEAKTASGLSNHSAEPNHVCANTTQGRICNSDSLVIVMMWALYAICVYGTKCA